MRTFILCTLLSLGGLATGNLAQEPAAPVQDLTPAETELIQHYLRLRDLEIQPFQEAAWNIRMRYERLILEVLPAEKHAAARLLTNGC